MRGLGPRSLLKLALVLATGCTSLVSVDQYSFDVDPCPPQPRECEGGREVAFVVRSSDVARADAEERRDGFDLDGTDAPICGQRDHIAPDGRTAIDNQMAGILELYEDIAGMSFREHAEAQILAGENIQLVVLSHVDDLEHDDCIEVTQRTGLFPQDVSSVDADGDGLLDPGLTLDYLPARGHDASACIVDGVVHGRFPPLVDTLAGTTIEATVDRGRLRMPITPEGSIGALLGGSIRISELTALPPAVIEFLRPRADLDPSSLAARDCSSISFGVLLDLVPCVLGERRAH